MPIEYSVNQETKEFKIGCHEVPAGGFKQIGKTRSGRKDGLMKASGGCVYTRDVFLPGMLYAKPYVCPYPHARIISMDTSKAETYPGVRFVLRYDDPRVLNIGTAYQVSRAETYVNLLSDTCISPNEVMGAVVIADTEDIADEALDLIEFEWEMLPWIRDTYEACQDTVILDPEGNVTSNPDTNRRQERAYTEGDLEAGFAEADEIVECTLDYTQPQSECPAEELVCVMRFREDWLEAWIHNQQAHVTHNWLAEHYPQSKIRCYSPYNGGTFGWQNWARYLDLTFPTLCMICAEKVKPRPVKLLWDKNGFNGVQETEGTHEFKVGIKNNGEITAYQCVNWGRGSRDSFWDHTKIKNFDTRNIDGFRNSGIRVCYRHGYNFGSIGQTFPFGHAGDAIGMDPTEVALANNGCEGEEIEWIQENIAKPQGFDHTRDSLKECLAAGKAAIDWDNKWHAPGTKVLPNGKYHGLGFAWFHEWTFGFRGKDGAATGLRVLEDGTVCIMQQSSDIGCATATAYCTVVADELGVPYDLVNNDIEADWENISHDGGCGGACISTTPAMAEAARKMRKLIFEAATTDCISRGGSLQYPAYFPGLDWQDLDMVDGMIFEKANPSVKVPLKDIAETCGEIRRNALRGPLQTYGWCYEPEPRDDYLPYRAMVRQCHFIEVEVDPETGEIDITKVVNVNDVGKAINPDVCKGQQYGGSYMGLGDGHICEQVWDPQSGVKLNDNLISYPYYAIKDISGDMEQILIETGLAYGAYGNAGIGETVAAMTSGLIIDAVHNAIGKWIDINPVSPKRVLEALGKG